jgi:hypothetical protein
MKVGDLVRTCTVDGYPLGLIVGVDEYSFGSVPRYKVLLEGRSYPFMAYQLQLVEAQNGKT